MGFGAIIASGERNQLLRDDLLDCITEVRVEQALEDPTQYAIRFQEDLSNGKPRIRGSDAFQCGEIITIAVKVADEIRCLVRGPITEREWSVMLGGPGSWFEIRGQDRRIEMDRQCKRRFWTGLESDAATAILTDEYNFDAVCIQTTKKTYGGGPNNNEPTIETLNQRATDEEFMRQIACRNNLTFWIDYECRSRGGISGGDSLEVTEVANLRSSPLRPDAEGLAECQDHIALHRDPRATLRVNVDSPRCQNVTAFNIIEDSERPSQFNGFAIDDRAGEEDSTEVSDPQPQIAKGGDTLKQCNPQRDVLHYYCGQSRGVVPQDGGGPDRGCMANQCDRQHHRAHVGRGAGPTRRSHCRGSRVQRQRELSRKRGYPRDQCRGSSHGPSTQTQRNGSVKMKEYGVMSEMLGLMERSFFGKYRGLVKDNNDPTGRGRLKVIVPAVLGDVQVWALPCTPYAGDNMGLYAMPEPGSGVWVEFEAGDTSYPIWVGCYWADGQAPKNERGDDATPPLKIIRSQKGLMVTLNDEEQVITASDKDGNNLITIEVQEGKITVKGTIKVVVEAPQIELVENSTHPLVFGDKLLAYLIQLVVALQAHQHTPTTPPVVVPVLPVATPDLISTRVRTG